MCKVNAGPAPSADLLPLTCRSTDVDDRVGPVGIRWEAVEEGGVEAPVAS